MGGTSVADRVMRKKPPYINRALTWAKSRYLADCQTLHSLGRLEIPDDGGAFVDGVRIRERVDIYTGAGAWGAARAQYSSEPPEENFMDWCYSKDFWRRFTCRPAVVLPPGEHPDEFRWTRLGLPWVRPTIIDTGDTGQDTLELLAINLIDAGAPGVRIYRLDGGKSIYIGEPGHV